jgi:queuine tRNA-ribosyltransferase
MPVGTKATVKALHPDEVQAVGAHVILANTYHLHFRPGEDVIEELGGLHAFSGWNGPILTDSGGFQVFSLRDTLSGRRRPRCSVVYDGSPERLTPERVADIQRRLGSDIAMCLDICPPANVSPREHEEAVRRTQLWAERQADAPRAPGQLRFGISQGGTDPDLRRRSVEGLVALPFDGFALGGLAVGESREKMLETVAWAAPALPAEQPRYFMGLGDAEGILEVVARGVDMFAASSHPTARTGSALTAGAQPSQRPVHGTPAARGLLVPRLHALHEGVRATSSIRTRSRAPAALLHNLWFVLD